MIIAVTGGSGAGKTTFAERLENHLDATVVSIDRYYRPFTGLSEEERHTLNFDDPATIDWTLLHTHLAQLSQGEPVNLPVYSFETSTRTGWETVPARKHVIVEGMHALYNTWVRSNVDTSVFLDVPIDIRMERRVQRDIKERGRSRERSRQQFLQETQPMHERYVEPTKQFADLLFSAPSNSAVQTVIDHVNAADTRTLYMSPGTDTLHAP